MFVEQLLASPGSAKKVFVEQPLASPGSAKKVFPPDRSGKLQAVVGHTT